MEPALWTTRMIVTSQAPDFLLVGLLIRAVQQVVSFGRSAACTVEDPDR